MSVYQPAGHRGEAPVADAERQRPLPVEDAVPGRHDARHLTPGILPSALRASLRLFEIAPGDSVGIDIETCAACGGAMRIIACIEAADVIERILTHLDGKAPEPEPSRRPPCRAPPQRGLFDETG